jgi:hypothetical protein
MAPPGELPPSPAAFPDPAAPRLAAGGVKVLVAIFVSLLGFQLASVPARNSDLWLHLAAGRDLATGASGVRVSGSQSWLYDLACYGLYEWLGGAGLALCKALLVAGLALLLLRLSLAASGWGLAAACTALALLAMGTRLLLQPTTISYFLLALTLWLVRPDADATRQIPRARFSLLPPWPLLVLFILWANLDRWFVLGLTAVAIVWLGQGLDLARQGDRRGLCFLVWWPVLAAVCLLNPVHVHAFALPAELGWLGGAEAPAAALARRAVASPFEGAYWGGVGLNAAGLAYFPLLGLGLFSFVLNLPRWHWQRFLPWLGLAVLSALQVRTVPFFAVVAGPVLAWNLGEMVAAGGWRVAHVRHGPAAALVGMLALALLVCAWPGWLQAPPFEPRRWAIETPPSLERGAVETRHWHQQGKLQPEARGLHLSPETAHVFAWFCPEEQGVLDEGLAATIRGARVERGRAAPEPVESWDERMRAAGINHVIVYDANAARLFTGLERLLADPEQWPLLYLEGNLAVFGWRDPARRLLDSTDPFQGLVLNFNRLAFDRTQVRKAPRSRPEREPEPRHWYEAFWKPVPPRPIDRDEATLYLLYAEAARAPLAYQHLRAWVAGQGTALIAGAGGWPEVDCLLSTPLRLALLHPQVPPRGSGRGAVPLLDRVALALRDDFMQQQDASPAALLYLAVRAARRALAHDPNDARAYLVLGESYLHLLHNTRERAWLTRLPQLTQLRQAQAAAAFSQAIFLQPSLAAAHFHLGWLYRKMGYLDLALHHLRIHQKLALDVPPEADVAQLRERQAGAAADLDRLASMVSEREAKWEAEAPRLRVGERALLAREQGLAGKARDLLLESAEAAFGRQGTALELELLLQTGRVQEVREWTLELTPKQKADLGMPAYYWLRARALAASGDYAQAEEELAQLATGGRPADAVGPRDLIALALAEDLLSQQPGGGCLLARLGRTVAGMDLYTGTTGLAWRMRQEADATVLRGLLALEEGRVDEAETAFRVALALWKDEAAASSGAGLDFDARPIAQGCLQWLE